MKFLVAYSGSQESKNALALACQSAKHSGAHVTVVVSMEGGVGERPEDIQKAQQSVKYAAAYLKEQGTEGEALQLVRGLSPGEDIVEFASENNIDQLYVGIEKKSKTRKMLLGSTAQFIILKAPCPVVTVK